MPSMIAKEMVDSSCEDAPVIVVSIAAIADQADLSPASLTGSLTVNGVITIPDAWAWRVNGATTGIGDATDPTTVFIPTTGGTYVATLAASIYGEWRYAEQEAFVVGSGLLTLSIDAIGDQSTLNPISFNSTVSGGVGTKTYSWLVNGSTSGLSSATAADPTFTPTVAGEHTAVCTITDEAGQTKTATRSFTIGTGALSVSIAAVSDQLTLAAATLDSTVTGGVTPYTYAWTVDGATTGLSSSTAADPTFTPTGAGTPTGVVTVTDAAGQIAKASVTWRVGDTSGLVTTYAPDLAAVASADWRSGGPGFTVGGQTITVRNQSTFSTGVLGPDGSTGIRFKPSSTSVNWSDADHSVGGVSLNLASLISGLTKNMPFDVIYAFRCDVDVSLDYQLFQVYVANNPHTSDPRGALVTRVNIAPNKILEASRRDGTTQVKVVLGTVATVRAIAWRIEGMTARLFYSTSAITSIPDASFTGWTEVPPYAMDIRDPNTAAQFTVADLTTGFNVGLAGTPAATLDLTITGLWVRAKL